MTKSKSKARQSRARRRFVAVHQDALMEAFARGFVAPREGGMKAEHKVTPPAIKAARAGAEWGDVVLLELAACGGLPVVAQPLLLADVLGCWTRTADAAAEIAARLETFDDTIPGMVSIEADPALFPAEDPVASQDPLPLVPGADARGTESIPGAAGARDAVALDKIAGGLAMLCARARAGELGFDALERLLEVLPDEAEVGGGAASLAAHAYRILRPDPAGGGDMRIFIDAARKLKEASPKQGLDPVAFVEQLDGGGEAAGFLDTLRKVLDNRIELSDSKLGDAGLVGQRSLLVFLLAPRAEELERWMRARPVGPVVATLASLLSGIYCGLGSITAELKAPTPGAMHAIVRASSSILDGLVPSLSVFRAWDENAVRREGFAIDGHGLLERVTPPAEPLVQLLAAARNAGFEVRVDGGTGECTALASKGAIPVELVVSMSEFRLPATQVARLAMHGRGVKRGQPTKELLAALLDRSLRPVVGTIEASGSVGLEVELDSPASVPTGVSQLIRAAGMIGLVQEKGAGNRRKRTATTTRASPRRKDAHAQE